MGENLVSIILRGVLQTFSITFRSFQQTLVDFLVENILKNTNKLSQAVPSSESGFVWFASLDFCQNPNLTTTQPQPNLNLVGFDMIITLHHPTHHQGGIFPGNQGARFPRNL